MNILNENNIVNVKSEQVCRTCLTCEGHFFNISDTFDQYTLVQMIQNIANLQIDPTDEYTHSVCFQCVKELRGAHTFRIKCLETNETLKKSKVLISNPCKIEEEESCDAEEYYIVIGEDCKTEIQDAESNVNEVEDFCDLNKMIDQKPAKDNDKKIFDCPLCHGLFYNDKIYQKHISELHSDRLNDECFSQIREPLGYVSKDKYSNKEKKLFKCVADEFIGNSIDEFKKHMKKHTGEKPVVCLDCGFRTVDIRSLKRHRLEKHTAEKKYSCTLCDYSCQSGTSWKNHLGTHTDEKNYKCKLCPMAFKAPYALSLHKTKIHDKRRKHVCEICQKGFFERIKLKDHMRTHTGERPHVCHHCGRAFASAVNMRTHVAHQHEPIKILFKCDLCNYSCKAKSQLKPHMKRHNGEKNFYCSQCPFSSLLRSSLTVHMLRHSAEKNFACDLCDYKAVSADIIKRHRVIHSGEKPFSCTVCEYRGISKGAVKVHMETHSTEQKFECPNCPYKTNVRSILAKHKRRNCDVLKRGRLDTFQNHKKKE